MPFPRRCPGKAKKALHIKMFSFSVKLVMDRNGQISSVEMAAVDSDLSQTFEEETIVGERTLFWHASLTKYNLSSFNCSIE